MKGKTRTSRLAVASFILAITALPTYFWYTYGLGAPLAIILGIVALRAIKKSRGKLTGRSLALFSLVIAIFSSVFFAIMEWPIAVFEWRLRQCTYQTIYQPSYIQVLAGPSEIWIFLEIQVFAKPIDPPPEPWPASSPMVSIHFAERGVFSTAAGGGRFQEVIVVGTSGFRRRIPLSIKNGVTFHDNLSYIVRLQDGIYLFKDESLYKRPTFFRWEEDHFERLPLQENNAFIEAHGMTGLRVFEQKKILDGLSRLANWEHVKTQYEYGAKSRCSGCWFTWHGIKFCLEDNLSYVKVASDAIFTLSAEEPHTAFKPIILTYTPDASLLTYEQARKVGGESAPDQDPYRKEP